jgi:mannosyltransferase
MWTKRTPFSWIQHLNKWAAAWAPHWVLLIVMLLGFGLRLYRLGDQDIWWDEGHAIWAARQSLAQATDITARDVHPPLYLWLLHGWLRLTGDSEFAVRYLSLMAGLAIVAVTAVVARRLLGQQAGWWAALFAALAR